MKETANRKHINTLINIRKKFDKDLTDEEKEAFDFLFLKSQRSSKLFWLSILQRILKSLWLKFLIQQIISLLFTNL